MPDETAATVDIPAAHVRALLKMLYPEHMTPVAKRQFDLLIEEYVERAVDNG